MVLTAIASLGDIGEKGLKSLVDRSGARDCIEIIFNKGDCSFSGCEISANKGEEKYLYHREKSGKPGMFLSWTISVTDVKKFQDLSKKSSRSKEDENQLVDFWKRKFEWFSSPSEGAWSTKSKIINDDRLMQIIDEDSSSFLHRLCESYANSLDRIRIEVGRQLEEYVFSKEKGTRTNKLLITIAFREGSGKKYPGDVTSFVQLFTRAVSGEVAGTGNLTCTVCNSQLGYALRNPAPLEFMTQDQLVYVPEGNPQNKGKAMALCQECSDRLRAGQAFINSNLSFRILRSKLFFWLVPVVPELAPVRQYILRLAGKKKPLYLRDLRNMCEGIETVSGLSRGSEETSEAEAWLTFTSVFCYKNTNGHTRVLGIAEGVYPSRLRELVEASRTVQRRYPYFLVDPKVSFSFPLLAGFFTGKKGETTITQVMESLFTKGSIDSGRVFWILAEKVRSEGLTRFKGSTDPPRLRMKNFVTKTLNALIIMEYLHETGVIKIGQGSGTPLMENVLRDQYVNEIQKFIASHRYLRDNETARSIFLTGVAVGILLEVQMKEFGSYPFWKHLNRLELDVTRIMSFYPQVKAKLVQYSKGEARAEIAALRTTVECIGANLNFEIESTSADQNLVDLLFSIGLSEGYLIYHTVSERRE
jgi:CRISPR-associated Csh1 family protein